MVRLGGDARAELTCSMSCTLVCAPCRRRSRARVGHRSCTGASYFRSILAQTMSWRWLLLFALALAAWDHWQARPIAHPPGVLASEDPLQADLGPSPPRLTKAGYQILPLQSFSLVARVLSKERYRFDEAADISPLDLALGWRRMSDQAVLDAFDTSQSGTSS